MSAVKFYWPSTLVLFIHCPKNNLPNLHNKTKPVTDEGGAT